MRFIALLFCCWLVPAAASTNDTLVIHSYHQGMRWTAAIQSGLESVAKPHGIQLHVNYLDSKRYQSPEYLTELLDLYRTKLAREHYRYIVVVDDNALWLLNKLGDEVGETPVVLLGINDYSPARHDKLRNVVGVLEQTDPSDNISLALSVQPDLERVYVIADQTVTGQALWKSMQEFMAINFLDLDVERVGPQPFERVFDEMAKIPPKSAIIYLSYYLDGSGHYMSSDVFLNRLTQTAAAPVYASYRYLLENGVAGGVMTSGFDKGRLAGQQLVKLVDGEITEFPAFVHNHGQAIFNYPVMRHWQLKAANIDMLVVNQPRSWLHRYQREIKVLAITLGVMGAVIMLLMMVIRRLRKGELRLRQSRALFAGVFNQSFQYIGILDGEGLLVSANLTMQDLVGRSVLKYDRPLWQWYCWSVQASQSLQQAIGTAGIDQPVRLELEIQSQDDGTRVLDIVVKRLPTDEAGEPQLLFEARDVTTRRQMEETLREREISYRLLYEQQPVMLLTVDRLSRIQSVNQFAADLLGYSKRELLGHKVTRFYDGDAPMPQQYIASARESVGPRVWRRQLRYCCADGRRVWIRETIRQSQGRQHLLVVGEDITSTRELEEKLAYQASHDYLTDLHNRNHFEHALETALQESLDQCALHAMFYIDLDQFKVINDTAGHEAGDEALKQVALLLKELTPELAVLARLGGDEFAIILHYCSLDEAVGFGRKVLKTLEAAEFYWQNTRFSFSASIGLRMIDGTAGSSQQVHAQADTACYAAKDEGRNRLHLYRPDDEELRRRQREMEWVSLIRRALVERRVVLYAQQIVPLNPEASQGHHYEILMRIYDDNGELVSPGVFMPAAERYNLAHRIDRYVVNEVFDWLVAHPEAVEALDMCAINLSGQSMGDRDFVHFLMDKIRRSGLPTHKLCLEITETAAIGNMSEAIRLCTQLKALGCVISLDDFGSGLSSFGYLKRLPVDIIKIDGMFVRDINDDEMDLAMVKAINELAKTMGKQTVAEFVESPQILAHLKALGVDYAQGYLFGQPAPLGELVAQLSNRAEVV